MGRIITLICDETPGLKLGPGVAPGLAQATDKLMQTADPRGVIVFGAGFAEFDEADFPDWRSWVEAPGTPHIEVIEPELGQVPATFGLGYDCPNCAAEGKSKSFATQRQLNGHRLSHAPRKTAVPA